MIKFSLVGDGELNIKRCYFGGTLKSKCPQCGEEQLFNGDGDYVSYPSIDDGIDFCCAECDHEWTPFKIVELSIGFAKNTEKE